jgi:hypothetical protein
MKRLFGKSVLLVGIAGLCFAAGLWVGRLNVPAPATETTATTPTPLFRFAFVPEGLLVQDNLPERDPNDPRELIPMPGPGGGNQPQPGQGGQPQECGIYLYQDGQLYQLQPGQQLPGQGDGSPELIPLNPVPGGPGGPSPAAPPPPPPGIES